MKKIFVGNLSYSVNEEDLKNLFSEYGTIVSLRLVMDRDTGRSKGFAFVEFENDDQAKASLELDGSNFKDRTMKVNEAKERENRGDGAHRGGGFKSRYR